jgi:hypothetical protein
MPKQGSFMKSRGKSFSLLSLPCNYICLCSYVERELYLSLYSYIATCLSTEREIDRELRENRKR